MKIYIASDHAGFEQKNKILDFLNNKFADKFEVIDIGPKEYDKDDDYPDYIFPCAEEVSKDKTSFGIILGKSGQGEAIAANRVKGVRAIVLPAENIEIINLGRKHNNANILSIGSGFLSFQFIEQAIDVFLNTEFSYEDRHIRRIDKLDKN